MPNFKVDPMKIAHICRGLMKVQQITQVSHGTNDIEWALACAIFVGAFCGEHDVDHEDVMQEAARLAEIIVDAHEPPEPNPSKAN